MNLEKRSILDKSLNHFRLLSMIASLVYCEGSMISKFVINLLKSSSIENNEQVTEESIDRGFDH